MQHDSTLLPIVEDDSGSGPMLIEAEYVLNSYHISKLFYYFLLHYEFDSIFIAVSLQLGQKQVLLVSIIPLLVMK